MAESVQYKLTRVRPPRVKITYDVETGGAIEKKELPYVIGVLASLSGDTKNTEKLKDRKFIEIDRDNVNEVMKKIGPTLQFGINSGDGEGGKGKKIGVNLSFQSMKNFDPVQVVTSIPELNHLYEQRNHLRDLLNKLEYNDGLAEKLGDLLDQVRKGTITLEQLRQNVQNAFAS